MGEFFRVGSRDNSRLVPIDSQARHLKKLGDEGKGGVDSDDRRRGEGKVVRKRETANGREEGKVVKKRVV